MEQRLHNRIFRVLFAVAVVAAVATADAQRAENVVADFNCDGRNDSGRLLIDSKANVATLAVKLADESVERKLQFGLAGNSLVSPTLCAGSAELATSGPDLPQLIFGHGRIPDGYWVTEQCPELVILSGECDAVHVYWNHNTRALATWRL